MSDLFSQRIGIQVPAAPIAIREDAPEYVRYAVADEARKRGLGPYPLREAICGLPRKLSDANNWSEYPNV